ncbi:MAG: TetR family transcriptional regulator [Rhodobacteraceae bacterium]|nr:TetR family transcriptional regulator [Paracoccaceae bacterium]
MSQPTFQRARTPEAKAARRSTILAATATVLAREGLEGTTLNAIARQAGMVKSGIYRYFESREDILMRLLTEDLRTLSATLELALSAPRPLPDVAQVLAGALNASPRLCLLISITALTLERNISTDTLRDIKRDMITSLQQTAAALRQSLPALSPARAEQAVHILFVLTAGLWPLGTPGPALKSLYDEPEFSRFNQDFGVRLAETLEAMLKGLTL